MEGSTLDLQEELSRICKPENVTGDEATLWVYSRDASFVCSNLPKVVVRPADTLEVSKIIKYAYKNGLGIIPSGGRSSLCGAGIPVYTGGILIDTTRLNGIEVHEDKFHVSVGGGCTFSRLDYVLGLQGLTLGTPGPFVSFSATIGGGLSVNAVSIYGAAMYGSISENVSGLEVVLPDGTILQTGAGSNQDARPIMRYCNGPDLTGLFLGAHGTLGIITKATFKIYPRHIQEAYFDAVFNKSKSATAACLECVRTGFVGLAMQFPEDFYRDLGLDVNAKGGFHLVVFGSEKDINLRKTEVERIISSYGGRKPSSLAPIFNAKELSDYRHWCAINGRWAEIAGFVESERVDEFLEIGCDFVRQNKEVIDKYVIIPYVGVVHTRHCADVFSLFLTYQPNNESVKIVEELREELLNIYIEKGLSPYWIGQTLINPLYRKLNTYYNFLKMIKEKVDPKGIMNPGVLEELSERTVKYAP